MAGPYASRNALAHSANKVVQWVRREEERVFIIGGAGSEYGTFVFGVITYFIVGILSTALSDDAMNNPMTQSENETQEVPQ